MIVLDDDEMTAVFQGGPLAIAVYLLLRRWMDYATGTVGVERSVAVAKLCDHLGHDIPRGKGFEHKKPSVQNVRTALEWLKKNNVIQQVASGERVVFFLRLAMTRSVRPKQTQHELNKNLTSPSQQAQSKAWQGFGGDSPQADSFVGNTHSQQASTYQETSALSGAHMRESVIPEDFSPSDLNQHEAKRLGLDGELEASAFVAFYQSNGVTRANWQAAFKKWLLDAHRYRTMHETGVMNANEIRALEEQDAYEGGDAFWAPLNFGTVGKDGQINGPAALHSGTQNSQQ
ncbi:hypothetical protein [Andreprevotia chitinilytica]|uniref:hypothetical protein n=1 Tax=Andreprevotia chitinilytica TaxID=396808 RepID=UPI000551BB86|nr:hypothetical protein [Andreprevotia chitinilytica]